MNPRQRGGIHVSKHVPVISGLPFVIGFFVPSPGIGVPALGSCVPGVPLEGLWVSPLEVDGPKNSINNSYQLQTSTIVSYCNRSFGLFTDIKFSLLKM